MMPTVVLVHDHVSLATGHEPADGIRHGKQLVAPIAALLTAKPRFKFARVFLVFRCLQDFLKWRDPDSNRGHHDFQIRPETYGSHP